ncbi:OsmC family protein [Bacillus sp. 03113]|uniref:OsmC family protein n=1 Tax=Bacillus sp. 03113 TaxID=2578211 RepID=UPI0011419E4D|nr:OsmC family protein [Bacillus sp. 03113]
MDFIMKDIGFYTHFPYGKLDIAGDEEYGFRPYQLMVSSIAVCSGGVLRNVLEKMRLEIEDIHIHADVKRIEEEANRLEKIHLHFQIKGLHLEEKKIEKALQLAQKNCPMVQSVKGSIIIEESFELI